MELRHLRYFVVVAEELNFRRAAQRLQMSQPPLSVQIAALEGEVGVRLLDRVGRQVSLTEAGRAFLPKARRTLFLADRAVRAARPQGGQATVTLGYTEAITFATLPEIVRRFSAENPAVKLELYAESVLPVVDALLQGDTQACLFRSLISRPGLRVEVCHREPFVAVLPSGHGLAGQREIQLAELRAENFVSFPRRFAPASYDLMTSMCLGAGFTPRITQEVYGYLGIVGPATAGLGVAVVPASVARWAPPGLVFTELLDVTVRSETVVAWRSDDDRPGTHALVQSILSS
jgi:DNA-binding transcriptional LysR family regulator